MSLVRNEDWPHKLRRNFASREYALLATYTTKKEAQARADKGRKRKDLKNMYRITACAEGYQVWWRQEIPKKRSRS